MPDLIARDDRELRRLEYAIASIEARHGSTLRHDSLLAALKAERNELLRISGQHGRGAHVSVRHAA